MNDKKCVALEAAQQVKNGMVVGLGTGSTADYFIQALAERCRQEALQLTTVASSVISGIKAQQLGLPQMALEQLTRIDLYVDGADEVTPDRTLLKGQGADLVREKLLANASDTFLVLIDQSKLVDRIGERFAIPIEVMPFAWQMVKKRLESVGGEGALRQTASGGMAVSSHGSLILDMAFDPAIESNALTDILNSTPGVVEHGIFHDLASAVFVAVDGKVEQRWK